MANRRKVLRLTGASIAGGTMYSAGTPVAADTSGIDEQNPENGDSTDDGPEDVRISNLRSASQALVVDVVDVHSRESVTRRLVNVPAKERTTLDGVIPKGTDDLLGLAVRVGGEVVAVENASMVAQEPSTRSIGITVLPDGGIGSGTPDVRADLEQACALGGAH